jgi:UDPglucose 6-dehydrogenase
MKIGIIGTGYVGLITGVGLASKGHQVTCFDNQAWIIEKLNSGTPHIHENGLNDLLGQVIKNNLFKAKLISESSLTDCEIIIVAVGTPTINEHIDLSYIVNTAETIGRALKQTDNFISVVIKSTVVPGTTDSLVLRTIEDVSGKKLGQFGLGMNPEFLREGCAIDDFIYPDRIVMGHEDQKTLNLLEKLYSPWDCDKISVNTRTAEMIKYANNCLLATQISAVNELANIAAATGNIDIMDVMKGVHADKRWNPILPNGNRIKPDILSYLIPGCGFGGSCFPKDVKGLRSFSKHMGVDSFVLDAVLKTNENQPLQVIDLLTKAVENLNGKKILILGLTFKPDTDDVRESISIKIIHQLDQLKVEIFAHDPIGIPNAKNELKDIPGIIYTENWVEVLSTIDVVLILTKWDEYKRLANKEMSAKLAGKILIDARRLLAPEAFPGSTYLSIGLNKCSYV